MSDITLNKCVFSTSGSAAWDSGWFPLDYKYTGDQSRSIFGSKAATALDSVILELRNVIGDVSVTVTATTWAGAVTTFSAVLQGPISELRVRKTGASAPATVTGIV